MAVPRLSPIGSPDEVALPQPLAPSDAARIKQVLALQRRGSVDAAAREAEELDSGSPMIRIMQGVILADRFLGRYTRPDAASLRSWLTRWPELPDAPAIYSLLLSRLPRGAPPPLPPPNFATLSSADTARWPASPPVPEETGTLERALARRSDLDRSVAETARRHGASGVRRLLARTSGLSGTYASQLSGEAARILFTLNRDEDALDIALDGMRVCVRRPDPDCKPAALAGYMAGLAAWRMDHPDQARPMFSAAWRSELTTPSLRAGAAFWAARTLVLPEERAAYRGWLHRAAAERATFYGLLASRLLQREHQPGQAGRESDATAGRETLAEADIEAVMDTAEGLRAFAMLQVGEMTRAEAELRRLWPAVSDRPALARAVMLVAGRAGLSDLEAQLADLVQTTDGRSREEIRFRVPRLRPEGGFSVDPAIVFALARTESNFDPNDHSSAGALGLMQIMPETADFITTPPGRSGHASGTRLRAMLTDPSSNLALGQRYIKYLSGIDPINGDLIRLLASYDCGPVRFAQWSRDIRDQGDPLLFLEAIPIDETRAYVPRVLTYTWLYAHRLRLATPSLDELASGDWPRYHALEEADFPVLH